MFSELVWDLVDRERYPLHDLESSAGRTLVNDCRRALDEQALCLLPGFLTSSAVQALCAEARALEPQGIANFRDRTPYGWMDNRGFAPDHPRSALLPTRTRTVTLDLMDDESPYRRLFFFDPLTEFIRQALGFETLYCSACPYLAIELKVMECDDSLSWHFDTNDGVVSLLLQAPDEGGHFEYVPYIRDEDDECYDEVKAVLEGCSPRVQRPPMAPGSLVLFKGRRSIHRVSPVGPTRQPRFILLFSYDHRPGMVFPLATVRSVTQPDGEPHRGTFAD